MTTLFIISCGNTYHEGTTSMPRSTLTAIIVTILCFAAAIFGLSYACVFTELDGLSIISHGIHVISPNETALTEKMEQYAEENGFRNFVGSDGVNRADCKREGVVITMRYTAPVDLDRTGWIKNSGIRRTNYRHHPGSTRLQQENLLLHHRG